MEAIAHSIGNITALVNGHITGRPNFSDRSFYRPMLADLLARIEARLEALGITASEASRNGGLSADAIRNIRRAVAEGRDQGVSTKTIAGLVKGLHTTEAWLMSGSGDSEAAATPAVPLLGRIEDVHGGPIAPVFDGWAPAIPGSDRDTVAVEVGSPLREFADEGTLLYFGYRTTAPGPELIDALSLIETREGPVVARLLRGSEPGKFDIAPLVGPKRRDVSISSALEFIGYLSARQAGRAAVTRRDDAA